MTQLRTTHNMESGDDQEEAAFCPEPPFQRSMLMARSKDSKRKCPTRCFHDTSTSMMAEDPTHSFSGPPSSLICFPNELLIEIAMYLQPKDLWNFQKTCRTLFWVGVAGMGSMDFLDRREHRQYVSNELYQGNRKKEESKILTNQFCCAGCKDTHPARYFSTSQLSRAPHLRCCIGRLGDFSYRELEIFEAASRPCTKKDYIWCPLRESRLRYPSNLNITVRYIERLSSKTPQRLLWASRKHAIAISADNRRLTIEAITKAINKLRRLRAPLCLHLNSSDPDVLVRFGDEAATNLFKGQHALSKPIKCPFDKCDMYHFFSHYTSATGTYQIVCLEIRQFLDFAHNGGDMPLPTDESWLVNTMEMCKKSRERKPLRRMLRDIVVKTRGQWITLEATLPLNERVRRVNQKFQPQSADEKLFAQQNPILSVLREETNLI
ncbi:hypothetical protein BDV97DRAFT_366963 [Delphinella strobiligena]|nr:hypothetical protein BDV97DRAFT_366963 [Delphinella strobiligena]